MNPEQFPFIVSGGQQVAIVHEFKLADEDYVVVSDGNDLSVYRRSELKDYRESYDFKQREKRAQELAILETSENSVVERMQTKALKQLEARMRLNAAFSQDGKASQVGIVLANELSKMIKEINIREMKEAA